MGIIEGSLRRDAVQQAVVAGAAAGDVTVTGIQAVDQLVSVFHQDSTDASEAFADLTSEFAIDSDDTINNDGGTASTGGFLLVTWLRTGGA